MYVTILDQEMQQILVAESFWFFLGGLDYRRASGLRESVVLLLQSIEMLIVKMCVRALIVIV